MSQRARTWVVLLLLLRAMACGNPRSNESPGAAAQTPEAPTNVADTPATTQEAERPPSGAGLPWLTDEKQALAMSREQNKPIFADFRADWCAPCIEMEKKTFADPKVAQHLRENYVLWRADVTESDDKNDSLMFRYKAKTLPMLVVIDKSGAVSTRIMEFVDAPELLKRLAP